MEGDVDVVADVFVAMHHLDGVDGERGGVGVVETNPRGAALGGEPFKQLAEGAAMVDVEAVIGGVLRDDDEFLYSFFYQHLGFGNQFVDGYRFVGAADEGDGAVGAAAVAALGDFEVGIVAWGGKRAGR